MRRIVLIVLAVVAVMMSMVAVRVSRMRTATPTPEDPEHVKIAIPEGYAYGRAAFGRQLDISPNGKQVVFVGKGPVEDRRLFLHDIDQTSPREIAGTDGAADPSFSPDGRYIAFYAARSVKKVALADGVVTVVGAASPTRGIAWLDDNTFIIGNPDGDLQRVDGAHHVSSPHVSDSETAVAHLSPNILPGRKALICTVAKGPLRNNRIVLVDLETAQERQLLDQNAFAPRYVPTGHIVFATGYEHQLMAVRFGLDKLEVVGTPMPVLKVSLSGLGSGGSTDYALSTTGTLAYTLRQEASFDDFLAHVGNFSLTEIHVVLNWTDQLKRSAPEN